LKGVGIGNGLVDTEIQMGSYGPFAYANKLIDESVYAQMNQTYAACQQDIDNENWNQAESDCMSLLPDVLNAAGNINIYNIDLQCNPPPLCYDLSNITSYLNLPSVQQALGVNGTWEACNDQVNGNFEVDELESYAYHVTTLLEAQVPVFVYSGMLDLISNYFGGDMWTSQLPWTGQDAFNDQSFTDYTTNDGKVAAHYKTSGGFTFMEVEGAGHMVPHDQPEFALEILQMIINGSPKPMNK